MQMGPFLSAKHMFWLWYQDTLAYISPSREYSSELTENPSYEAGS